MGKKLDEAISWMEYSITQYDRRAEQDSLSEYGRGCAATCHDLLTKLCAIRDEDRPDPPPKPNPNWTYTLTVAELKARLREILSD